MAPKLSTQHSALSTEHIILIKETHSHAVTGKTL